MIQPTTVPCLLLSTIVVPSDIQSASASVVSTDELSIPTESTSASFVEDLDEDNGIFIIYRG